MSNQPNQPDHADPAPTQPETPAAATATRPAPPKLDKLPLFKVLLHNDDVNDMDWVIHSILELTPHQEQRAVELTVEAHKTGVALLLVTHKERAELYQDQFKSKQLTVTIEAAE